MEKIRLGIGCGLLFWCLSVIAQVNYDTRYDSLDEAAADVRKRTGGRVLSAKEQQYDGEQRYRIKILTPDGRVKQLNMRSSRPHRQHR